MQLKTGSEFLENQQEDFLPILERLKKRKIVSFYETVKTPSVRRVIRTVSVIYSLESYLLHLVGIRQTFQR